MVNLFNYVKIELFVFINEIPDMIFYGVCVFLCQVTQYQKQKNPYNCLLLYLNKDVSKKWRGT